MPTTACPDCLEEVYVDADAEQGDVVICDECGVDLEIVGLDPVELDTYYDSDFEFEDQDDSEDDTFDY